MRRSVVTLIAALATGIAAQPSHAADLPLKAPAAVAAPLYNWSGIYIGGNIGYGWSDAGWTDQDDTTLFGDYVPPDGFSNKLSGIIGGGQIGFNYQTGNWVLGAEAMFDAASVKGDFASDTLFGAGDDQFEARIKTLMLFTARVGYAWNNVLAYGKAGIAAANIEASVSDDVGPNTGSGSESHWLAGPTVGAGLEYGITPNLSIGAEYDYIHLDSSSYQLGDASGSYSWDVNVEDVHMVLAKLNYRFNWSH